MPKTDAFVQALEDLIFQNVALANIGTVAGLQPSSSAGSLYLSLHTASPGTTGNQATNEVSYTGYARVAVARSSAGWTRSADVTSLFATANFPQCTGGSATATYAGIGTDSSGNGHLLYYGAITPSLAISNGITPQLTTGSTITES